MAAPTIVETAVDYDVHGLVGVRLLGAGPRETAAVDRQLGPSRRGLDREPEITVRFVDRLDLRGPLRLIGLEDAAYTDDAFLVLRSKHKAQARVQYRRRGARRPLRDRVRARPAGRPAARRAPSTSPRWPAARCPCTRRPSRSAGAAS